MRRLVASSACPRCGRTIRPEENFCGSCGTPVQRSPAVGYPTTYAYPSAQPPPVYVPPGYATPPAYPQAYPPPISLLDDRPKWVKWTKWGVLFLAAGLFIQWIPAIGILGGILAIIGAFFMIFGRKGFTERHPTLLWAAVVVWFVAVAVAIYSALALFLGNLSQIIAEDPSVPITYLKSDVQNGILAGVVAAVLFAVAHMLIVWEITADLTRRILLTAFFGAVAAASVSTFFLLQALPPYPATLTGPQQSAFEDQTSLITLMSDLTYYVLFGIAFLFIYSKIRVPEPAPYAPWGPPPPALYSPPPPTQSTYAYSPPYRPPP